jgi:hypothetical protein
MDTLENHLAALLASGAPPARDIAFELAVAARIERQRVRRELAQNAAIAAGVGVLLFWLAPELGLLLQGANGDLVATLAMVAGGIVAMQWSLQRMEG